MPSNCRLCQNSSHGRVFFPLFLNFQLCSLVSNISSFPVWLHSDVHKIDENLSGRGLSHGIRELTCDWIAKTPRGETVQGLAQEGPGFRSSSGSDSTTPPDLHESRDSGHRAAACRWVYVRFIPSDGPRPRLASTVDKEISVPAPVILPWQGCRSRMCRDRCVCQRTAVEASLVRLHETESTVPEFSHAHMWHVESCNWISLVWMYERVTVVACNNKSDN